MNRKPINPRFQRPWYKDLTKPGWFFMVLAIVCILAQWYIFAAIGDPTSSYYLSVRAYHVANVLLVVGFAATIAFAISAWRTLERRRNEIDRELGYKAFKDLS
ncbi:hypothetical protein BSR29_03185 [Boudabousia liubingyangii]|uniref:Uncharacterized protein n=1 Tax=Boudabousia liubingyangii TaxID=1921764 RepID=A0A1Q5PMT8_9ACTO|nr:hypothetical protein [Boudabousia liubingyangii]OKL47449.1 hypothetical protein BSR28_02760 [Boudabousia liubingyangii]OKL48871.1 hypothetical protein BSR29_03185 [Boudabousia liubingyangii]